MSNDPRNLSSRDPFARPDAPRRTSGESLTKRLQERVDQLDAVPAQSFSRSTTAEPAPVTPPGDDLLVPAPVDGEVIDVVARSIALSTRKEFTAYRTRLTELLRDLNKRIEQVRVDEAELRRAIGAAEDASARADAAAVRAADALAAFDLLCDEFDAMAGQLPEDQARSMRITAARLRDRLRPT